MTRQEADEVAEKLYVEMKADGRAPAGSGFETTAQYIIDLLDRLGVIKFSYRAVCCNKTVLTRCSGCPHA